MLPGHIGFLLVLHLAHRGQAINEPHRTAESISKQRVDLQGRLQAALDSGDSAESARDNIPLPRLMRPAWVQVMPLGVGDVIVCAYACVFLYFCVRLRLYEPMLDTCISGWRLRPLRSAILPAAVAVGLKVVGCDRV